jgi:hypothetical protein
MAGHVHAIGEAYDRYAADGWRLAFVVKTHVDPKASEVHRQAVEDAAAVLEYFNPDGFVFSDADDATVVSAIATLRRQVIELLPIDALDALGVLRKPRGLMKGRESSP